MSNWLKKLFRGNENTDSTPSQNARATPRTGPGNRLSPEIGAWIPGGVILGEYTIEKELGRGGMGRVWLVKSNSTGRRFAVKQMLISDEKHRQAFLTELQTWIDLPEHPNVVRCRFFRTTGDEMVIFADYVEGGSLADWIANGKLERIEQIMDVAIQFAWGLQAIHHRGLVHQDVKPGNVLMTPEGTPMVADFGLARARLKAADGTFVSPSSPQGEQSILVSSGGMTPAYASPEQRAGKPLSRKTDIWSWGVSVMDMFTAGVSCLHGGHIALEVLEDSFAGETETTGGLAMPSAVKDILRRCFARSISERWSSFEELSSSLIHAYGEVTGKAYPRAPTLSPAQNLPLAHDRRIQNGRWRDPRTWLREAYRATGRDPADAARYQVPDVASRRGAEVADLAIYDEVERLLTSAIGPNDDINANLLASFYADKALLSFAVHDAEAVFSAADKCVAIRERLVLEQKRHEFAADLASAYMHKSMFNKWSGDHLTSIELYDKCISLLERLFQQEQTLDLGADLARAYMNKACDLTTQGAVSQAIALFDKGIATLHSAKRSGKTVTLDDDLAHLLMNKAGALMNLGDACGAAKVYSECIGIRAPLVEVEGRQDLENDLADAYMGNGVALGRLNQAEDAMKMFDRAVQIRERLVLRNGNSALERALADSYVNKAEAHLHIQDIREAERLFFKACTIYERLVVHEGRHNAADGLANVYMCMANAKRTAGDLQAALLLHEKCIDIRERLIAKERRTEVEVDLAKSYMNKGNVLNDLGLHLKAMAAHDKCIAIRERIVYDQGREDLADILAVSYSNKAAPAKKLGDFQQAKALYDKAIAIYERLIREGRSDSLPRLAWARLSRSSVVLASGKMDQDEVVRARHAYELACQLAEELGNVEAEELVEWGKLALGAVLFEGGLAPSLDFSLPSGLKGCVSSSAAIIAFNNVTKWLRCPAGHFWFATPNISMSPPPYSPKDEIYVDEVSAPVPKSRKEAMEYVHVYVEDRDHGLFWRGDWMDSFPESYPMTSEDKSAWLKWVSAQGEYLDGILKCAAEQAARAARIKEVVQPGPVAYYSLITASEMPRRTVHQMADRMYKLSELIKRSYRLTSGMRQADYETAVNVVAGGLREQGYRLVYAERERSAPCSLIAESRSGSVGIKVVSSRAPDSPEYDKQEITALRKFCAQKTAHCAIAPVGLMLGTKRSPDGVAEFYVKYEGLVSV